MDFKRKSRMPRRTPRHIRLRDGPLKIRKCSLFVMTTSEIRIYISRAAGDFTNIHEADTKKTQAQNNNLWITQCCPVYPSRSSMQSISKRIGRFSTFISDIKRLIQRLYWYCIKYCCISHIFIPNFKLFPKYIYIYKQEKQQVQYV